jgi:hypothetical protein
VRERILQLHETVLGKLTCAGEGSTAKRHDSAQAPEGSILIAVKQQMLKGREEAANMQQSSCVQTEQQLNTPTISNAREIDDLCTQMKQVKMDNTYMSYVKVQEVTFHTRKTTSALT